MMKENLKESQFEKLLKIRTTGRDDSRSDQYRYPYEPTPYCVLERLTDRGMIGKKNVLLDYGCGKGRVDFFLAYQTRCKTIGIEYDERIHEVAINNQKTAVSGNKTEFVLANAETYEVQTEVDRCYFFNPFSVEVLQKVLARVLESYYAKPRELLLFFYYPSDEYMGYFMTREELMFVDEVDCRDLFEGDEREKVVVFEVL